MIIDEIDQLIRFVQIKTGVNCSFGDVDLGADDLPHIKIIPVSSVGVVRVSEDDNSVSFQVMLKIICQRKDERRAIGIMERLLTAMPHYHAAQGHIIASGGGGTMEYTPNTYEIDIPYVIKAITGD